LSEAFLIEIGRGLGRPAAGISKEARQLLLEYHWPGNVRELHNVLERASILCDGGLINVEHVALTAPAVRASPPSTTVISGSAGGGPTSAPPPVSADDLQSIERAMIEQALQTARFNKSRAAKALGMTRNQLYVRLKKHGLE
jgi:Nif-specific regulatory protein